MIENMKLTKIVYEYNDGTIKTLEGQDVETYESFLNNIIVLADLLGKNPNWDSLQWKLTPSDELKEYLKPIDDETDYQQ